MRPGSSELREYNDGRSTKPVLGSSKEEEIPLCTTLPPGFKPLCLNDSLDARPYLTYLTGRGVSERSVALYRMGYVTSGLLSGRVIVPSFDAVGSVNFWSARTIWGDTPTYRLPYASKDVVSNEHMVDWTEPVYLVEGVFDEVAIGPQAISLYGKFMQPTLAQRLVTRRPPIVYVCLDNDARSEARTLVQQLVGYDIPCALVDLPGKDPGELGYESVRLVAEASPVLTGSAGLLSTGVR